MKKSIRILCVASLATLMLTTFAAPAMAGTVAKECGAGSCTSMTFREYCQGAHKNYSKYYQHETSSSVLCNWRYKNLWTMIKCTKCGNTYKNYSGHPHKTEHSTSCGMAGVICTLPR